MLPPHPSDPATHQIEIDGIELSHSIEGSGAPLVAVHGAPGTPRDFRWLAPALAHRFRVIRVQLVGRTIHARTELLRRAIERLGLDRPIVLGHSLGGAISVQLAARHPDHVRALALLATPGLTEHRGFRRFPRELASSLVGSPARARLLAPLTRRVFKAAGFTSTYPDALLVETLQLAASVDFSAHVKNVRALAVPTLVAWAEDDPLIEPSISRRLAEACPPGPRLAFPEGRHNIQKSCAVEIAEAVGQLCIP